MVLTLIQSDQCPVSKDLKMDTFGSSRSGKISSRYFVLGAKNKNLARQFGIGVLVVGFSQIGAVENMPRPSLPHIGLIIP